MFFRIPGLMHVDQQLVGSPLSFFAAVPLHRLRRCFRPRVQGIQNAACADKQCGPMTVELLNSPRVATPEQGLLGFVQAVVALRNLSPIKEGAHG
jgi:hypothetical protein